MTGATNLTTGIPSLDRLMGGGIPARQVVLIAGQPGSGKTILAGQMAFAHATQGTPVLIATAASEPHTKILESLQAFTFFQRERVGRELFLLSVYPWLRKGPKETRELLLSSVRDRKARLLIVDGLRSLRDIWRDESVIREFLSEVGVGLASNDCTGVFTLEASPERILELPEAATVDGVLTLSSISSGMRRLRRIEVVKVRGRQHQAGAHSAHLGAGGFTVVPQLELSERVGAVPPLTTGRVPFGIGPLDDWLGGGVPSGGATLLVGSVGAGKSLLAASWARAGLAAGERVLFVSLQEHGDALLARAKGVGIDLRSDALDLWAPIPVALDADEVGTEIWNRATRFGARRVVIDGIEALEAAIDPPTRQADFFTALARGLRSEGRELLLTCDSIELQRLSLQRIVDNVLELRVAERGPEFRHELIAVKIRAGSAPLRPWSYAFTATGIATAGRQAS